MYTQRKYLCGCCRSLKLFVFRCTDGSVDDWCAFAVVMWEGPNSGQTSHRLEPWHSVMAESNSWTLHLTAPLGPHDSVHTTSGYQPRVAISEHEQLHKSAFIQLSGCLWRSKVGWRKSLVGSFKTSWWSLSSVHPPGCEVIPQKALEINPGCSIPMVKQRGGGDKKPSWSKTKVSLMLYLHASPSFTN